MKKLLLLNVLLFLLTCSSNLLAQLYHEINKYTSDSIIENARFGSSLAIHENHLVIGAPKENKVYILMKESDEWQQVAVLTPSDTNPGKHFGQSVAIYEDVIIVGSPGSNMLPYADPSVYIFQKPGNGWTDMNETAILSRTSTDWEQMFSKQKYDYFGHSVGIYGNTAVIGAYGYSSDNTSLCGGVFVYQMPDSGWRNMTETARLYASDEDINKGLGRAVHIYKDVIVAGEGRMNATSAAYLFEKPADGWKESTETAKFRPQDDGGTFGASISIGEDVVVIGGPSVYGTRINSGAVFVFVKPESGWSTMNETAKLIPSNLTSPFDFGKSVSISGNYIVVGDPGATHISPINQGLGYFFEKPEDGWASMTETAILRGSDISSWQKFGFSVINTESEIFIGANETKLDEIVRSGSVYEYDYVFGPQDIQLSNNKIEECSNNGTFIGSFSAIDGNRYDKHTFEFINEGNNYSNDDFLIRADSLFVNTNLDFEKKSLYKIFLEVTDTTELSFKKEFDIDIINLRPLISDTSFVVREFSPEGTYIGKVVCKGDTNSIYFRIAYYTYGEAFKIDSLSGKIYVNNPVPLNSQFNSHFILDVAVSDGMLGSWAKIRIDYGEPTSIETQKNCLLKVFPIPARDFLKIEFCPETDLSFQMEIINLNGVIIHKEYIHERSSINIDVSSFPKGLYLLKLTGRSETFIKRFIKN